MELPEYFPISSESISSLEHLKSRVDNKEELESTEQRMLDAAKSFLDELVTSDVTDPELDKVEPLNALLEAYAQLKKSQSENASFNKSFQTAKHDTRIQSRTEEALSVRNLDHYKTKSKDSNFSARFDALLADPQNLRADDAYKADPDYIYLKNGAFVIQNPDKPLPNDEEEDDDLEIEGGIIDLRCPLTLQLFENPYTSKKCGHTFDQAGIRDTWKTPQVSMDCPIPGCRESLRLSDFQVDRLMALRIKAYNKKQKTHKDRTNYERI